MNYILKVRGVDLAKHLLLEWTQIVILLIFLSDSIIKTKLLTRCSEVLYALLTHLELLFVLQTEGKLDKANQSVVKVVVLQFVVGRNAHAANQLVNLSR